MTEFDTLVNRQALLVWLSQIDHQIEDEMIDILRLDQTFADYHARMTGKQHIPQATLAALGINEEELWQWFLRSVIHRKSRSILNSVGQPLVFSQQKR